MLKDLSHCTALKTLWLPEISAVDDEVVSAICSSCLELEELNLQECSLTDHVLPALPEKIKSVWLSSAKVTNIIDLSSLTPLQLTLAGLLTLNDFCKDLVELSLSGMSIPSLEVLSIAEQLPKLQRLIFPMGTFAHTALFEMTIVMQDPATYIVETVRCVCSTIIHTIIVHSLLIILEPKVCWCTLP